MNSSSFMRLAQRRAELIARCAEQRDALSTQKQSLIQITSTLDYGLTLVRRIKSNPLALAGIMAAVLIIKPRRLLALARTSLVTWQALRTVTPLLQDMRARYQKKSGV
ncbi:MAG: YqjK family protein [Burkholderiaceae bacterium]